MRVTRLVSALLPFALASGVVAQDANVNELDLDSEWDAVLLMSPPAVSASAGEDEPTPPPARRKERKEKNEKARRRSNGTRSSNDSGYRTLKKLWHAAPVEDGSWGSEGRIPALDLRALGDAEPCLLTPASEAGGFAESDLLFASRALGGWEGGPTVHPRLLDLIYRAMRNFDVPFVHVVSGIRKDRTGSRHSHGLAADIVLPGVGDEQLAAFFRAQGFVGVGTYTRSGFVHIDVRESSYFWVDLSPPGKHWKVRQVRADEAKAADAAALERGEGPHLNPAPLQRVLEQRAQRRRRAAQPEPSKRRRS